MLAILFIPIFSSFISYAILKFYNFLLWLLFGPGNGKPIQIYDGRKSLSESKNEAPLVSTGKVQTSDDTGKGEIIYFRDSDDEMPDSDEDPDDDLDI